MALKHMQANGQRTSRFAPFGHRHGDGGNLVEVPHEQEAIRAMLDLRSRGMAYAKIGEQLDAGGLHGRNGQRISGKVVRSIIQRTGQHPQETAEQVDSRQNPRFPLGSSGLMR